jgi:uncharacterized membrane protein HdeD (DUF308 family)
MAVKKKGMQGDSCSCSSGMFVFAGIISIILGLVLWFGYLTLTQVFALLLVLMGIKKLYHKGGCCH